MCCIVTKFNFKENKTFTLVYEKCNCHTGRKKKKKNVFKIPREGDIYYF